MNCNTIWPTKIFYLSESVLKSAFSSYAYEEHVFHVFEEGARQQPRQPDTARIADFRAL